MTRDYVLEAYIKCMINEYGSREAAIKFREEQLAKYIEHDSPDKWVEDMLIKDISDLRSYYA